MVVKFSRDITITPACFSTFYYHPYMAGIYAAAGVAMVASLFTHFNKIILTLTQTDFSTGEFPCESYEH